MSSIARASGAFTKKFNAQTHFKLTDDIQFLSTSPGPPGDPVMLNMTVDGDFKSGRSRGARVRRSPG